MAFNASDGLQHQREWADEEMDLKQIYWELCPLHEALKMYGFHWTDMRVIYFSESNALEWVLTDRLEELDEWDVMTNETDQLIDNILAYAMNFGIELAVGKRPIDPIKSISKKREWVGGSTTP